MNRFAAPIQLCKSTVSLLLCCTLFTGALPAHAYKGDSAHKLFVEGQSAEAREDYDGAYEDYKKAYAKAPNDLRMRTAYYRLRQTASSTHVTTGRKLLEADKAISPPTAQAALAQFMRATEIDPGNEAALQEIAKLRSHETGIPLRSETSLSEPAQEAIEDAGSPAELKAVSSEPLTLRMTQDSKIIYQAIGKAAGINVLFDPDYNGKNISVELNNVTLMDALRIVGTLSNTFWRPVTSNTIFVATNNRSKHTELDEQAVQTFYLSNAWQQSDLNDVQTALRNVMANAKVYGVPSQNAIVVRATPDELTLAQKIINDLDKARPEVVVDVAIMEVDKDKMRNIGLSWPGSISFALQPPTTSTSSTTTTTTTSSTSALTLDNLANLNANSFAVTVSSATANLLLSDSDTKILQNPRIRATDGQKATMKIGSRIPIATGSYQTGATTAITSSLVNTQFQYQDVGVQIEMTPTVHFDHDVTLKLKIEDTSESGTETISGVTEPIIAQKTSEQTIRLREGEASILAGILNKQDLVSISGIPGLGELPLLKYIFGSKSHEVIDDEVVFVLIPHIVRGQELSPLNLRRIDTGSGQTIELRHIGDGAPKPAQPAPIRPTGAQNGPGGAVAPLQGQTAAAAVNNAMQQLRQEATGDAPRLNTPPPAPPAQAVVPPAGLQSGPQPTPGFVLTGPAAPVAVGAQFPVAVMLNDAHGVASAAFQIQYDPDKLTLVGFNPGELLNQGGQQATVMHKDEPIEGSTLHNINIVAARPLGTPGVNGSGAICTLTFQAKIAGASDLVVASHSAVDAAQQSVQVSAQNAHIVSQ
jgi:general secretion pathway protein D